MKDKYFKINKKNIFTHVGIFIQYLIHFTQFNLDNHKNKVANNIFFKL